MDKKRNIFDREMGLCMNSKKCCSLTGTDFKQKSMRIEMWMKWKKFNWSIWFFFNYVQFFFKRSYKQNASNSKNTKVQTVQSNCSFLSCSNPLISIPRTQLHFPGFSGSFHRYLVCLQSYLNIFFHAVGSTPYMLFYSFSP